MSKRASWEKMLGVLLLLWVGEVVSVGCSVGCESLASRYQLSSSCLLEGGVDKQLCAVEQNECTVVVQCGSVLSHCRGYMTGSTITLNCTLADKRNSQVIADLQKQGEFQWLFLQKANCKASWVPVVQP